jgi:hypothetical protein
MSSLLSLSVVSATAFLLACGSTASNSPPTTLSSLGTSLAGDVTVELLTGTKLETGMNAIYLKLTDASGNPVTDATVAFIPMMYMSTGMNHSSPVYGPPALDANGMYRCDAVFQMPSGDTGYWDMQVTVERPGAAKVEAVFPKMNVTDSGRSATFLYTDPVTSVATKYVVSMNFASAPKVGLNPIIISVNSKQDMMTFPPVDGLQFILDPQMPSMGHGSPGSVNPTPTTSGLYSGKLSFSMTGPWETTVTISKDGVELGKPVFKTTF